MANRVFKITAGDTHRRLLATLENITTVGASGVTFKLRRRGSAGPNKAERAGTIVNDTQVSVQWQAADIDTPGTYDLKIVLTFGDGPENVPTEGFFTLIVGLSL